MSTGLHYLDLGLGTAVFVWIVWWTYTLCSRASAQRTLERSTKRFARQPWDNDKVGRRGNR